MGPRARRSAPRAGVSLQDALQASSSSVGFGAPHTRVGTDSHHGDFGRKIRCLANLLTARSEQARPRTIGARASKAKPQSGHLCLLYEKLSVLDLAGCLMTASMVGPSHALARALAVAALLALGLGLNGCTSMSDEMTGAFADPAKYSLFDCKQLEAERKKLAVRSAELQGLMEKAQTGVGGPVVAEMAYGNDYIMVRGQAKNAEEAWRQSKCHETPVAVPAVNDKSGRPMMRSGNAVY